MTSWVPVVTSLLSPRWGFPPAPRTRLRRLPPHAHLTLMLGQLCPTVPPHDWHFSLDPNTHVILGVELRFNAVQSFDFKGMPCLGFKSHRVLDIFIYFKELERNLIIIFIFFKWKIVESHEMTFIFHSPYPNRSEIWRLMIWVRLYKSANVRGEARHGSFKLSWAHAAYTRQGPTLRTVHGIFLGQLHRRRHGPPRARAWTSPSRSLRTAGPERGRSAGDKWKLHPEKRWSGSSKHS